MSFKYDYNFILNEDRVQDFINNKDIALDELFEEIDVLYGKKPYEESLYDLLSEEDQQYLNEISQQQNQEEIPEEELEEESEEEQEQQQSQQQTRNGRRIPTQKQTEDERLRQLKIMQRLENEVYANASGSMNREMVLEAAGNPQVYAAHNRASMAMVPQSMREQVAAQYSMLPEQIPVHHPAPQPEPGIMDKYMNPSAIMGAMNQFAGFDAMWIRGVFGISLFALFQQGVGNSMKWLFRSLNPGRIFGFGKDGDIKNSTLYSDPIDPNTGMRQPGKASEFDVCKILTNGYNITRIDEQGNIHKLTTMPNQRENINSSFTELVYNKEGKLIGNSKNNVGGLKYAIDNGFSIKPKEGGVAEAVRYTFVDSHIIKTPDDPQLLNKLNDKFNDAMVDNKEIYVPVKDGSNENKTANVRAISLHQVLKSNMSEHEFDGIKNEVQSNIKRQASMWLRYIVYSILIIMLVKLLHAYISRRVKRAKKERYAQVNKMAVQEVTIPMLCEASEHDREFFAEMEILDEGLLDWFKKIIPTPTNMLGWVNSGIKLLVSLTKYTKEGLQTKTLSPWIAKVATILIGVGNIVLIIAKGILVGMVTVTKGVTNTVSGNIEETAK